MLALPVSQVCRHNLATQGHDLSNQIFEIDPSKLDRKSNEVLWSPADRPDKPLATSDWVVDDIGAAFTVKVGCKAKTRSSICSSRIRRTSATLPKRAACTGTRAAIRSIANIAVLAARPDRLRYFRFLLIQPSMNLMISSLFRSRNISCMFPWMPTSSRRTKSSFAPA